MNTQRKDFTPAVRLAYTSVDLERDLHGEYRAKELLHRQSAKLRPRQYDQDYINMHQPTVPFSKGRNTGTLYSKPNMKVKSASQTQLGKLKSKFRVST